jgi:hypothetical protein
MSTYSREGGSPQQEVALRAAAIEAVEALRKVETVCGDAVAARNKFVLRRVRDARIDLDKALRAAE